ncbi:MAG: hypothetical protein PHR19_06195 [Bacteroidales bacterium]|nr:hypothetical protein [Bacteroidales bacterium]
MNNLGAISKIKALKQTEVTDPSDFQFLFDAATLIEASRAKIAIIGTKSKGKSLLINLLCGKRVADEELDITIPTCFGEKCFLSSTKSTDFCKNNNVIPLKQEKNFCWNNTCSYTISEKLDLKAIYSSHSEADGIFCLYDDSKQGFASNADILLPPDVPTKTLSKDIEKNIINMVDIADVVILVGTPDELNSTIFDFILNNNTARNKSIMVLSVHQDISNYYHYILTPKDNNAEKIEADNRTSSESLYNIIYAPTTSPATVQSLKDSLINDTQTLIQNLESIVCKNYNKIRLEKVFYLPTSEKNVTSKIIEDQKVIQDVINWQRQRIYNELTLFMSKVSGKTPFVAWSYFLRKFEDIYFDRISPKWLEVYSQTIALHSRCLVIDSQLKEGKKELQTLLRDYYKTSLDEEKLKHLFLQYCKSKGFLNSLVQGKSASENLYKQMLLTIQQSNYMSIIARLKQQHNALFPTCEQILTQALTASNFKAENCIQFIKSIKEAMLANNLIILWEKYNPLTQEKNDIINQKRPKINALKQILVDELAKNIEIATELERDNEISFTIAKHREISVYSPDTTLKSLC